MKGTNLDGRQWTKSNEMDYVTQLVSGECFAKDHRPQLTPKQLLENYIKSARKRMAWKTYVPGGNEVLEYAVSLWSKQKS